MKETKGIPVDLISYAAASVAARDYLESIWLAACEISWEAVPLVLFVQGMDDSTADSLDLDFAIGAGCLSCNEQASGHDNLTASPELFNELLQALQISSPDLRIRQGVKGYALETGDEVAWWLRRTWNDHYVASDEDFWRAPEVNCLSLTLRYSGLCNTSENLENTVGWLAEVINNLSELQFVPHEVVRVAEGSDQSGDSPSPRDEKGTRNKMKSASEALEAEVLPIAESPAPTTRKARGNSEKRLGDDSLVREALHFIREKANETVYKGSIEIGDYMLEKFFGGDIERAKSKKPTKRSSYIALCRHQELVVHPATLGIMVRVAAQEKFFKAKKLPADKLSYSHKAELVKLEDDQEKSKLFKEAVSKSLSVRDLANRVRKNKNAGRTTAKQNLLSGKQGVFNPEVLLKNPVWADEEKLRELPSEDLKGLLSQVTETLDRLAAYVAEYNRIRKRLETISQESAEKHSS